MAAIDAPLLVAFTSQSLFSTLAAIGRRGACKPMKACGLPFTETKKHFYAVSMNCLRNLYGAIGVIRGSS